MSKKIKSPILFIVFNRPDTTFEVFNAIREYEPNRIYLAADGPRQSREDDILLCEKTRNVINLIDWPCEIFTLFRDSNLGCKDAVSEAITWFFENEEMGVILEDDCLPNISFFNFCTELLEKYKDDNEIMAISGQNFLQISQRNDESYFFSEYPLIWGWATWRRAWTRYDKRMQDLESFITKKMPKKFKTNKQRKYLKNLLLSTWKGKINTWDYQWIYTILNSNAMVIIPSKNLVLNIGFRNQSTHDFLQDSLRENKILDDMETVLKPPKHKLVNRELDFLMYKNVFSKNIYRVIRVIKENGLPKIISYSMKKIKKANAKNV